MAIKSGPQESTGGLGDLREIVRSTLQYSVAMLVLDVHSWTCDAIVSH